jgi:hypothetical protein
MYILIKISVGFVLLVIIAISIHSCAKKKSPHTSSFEIPFSSSFSIREQNQLLADKIRGILTSESFVQVVNTKNYSDNDSAWIVYYSISGDSSYDTTMVNKHEIPFSKELPVSKRNTMLSDTIRSVHKNTNIMKIELEEDYTTNESAWIIYEVLTKSK